MKKSIHIFLVIPIAIGIGIMLLTYSCDLVDPVDDIKPLYKLTEENLFTDAAKTEAVLNGVYVAWKGFYINQFTPIQLVSSVNYEFHPGIPGSDQMYENRAENDIAYLGGYYSEYYRLIQRANYLIKALQSEIEIPGLTAERRIEIEAEARLHRAMVHFILLRNFGQFYDVGSELGIVISAEPITEKVDDPRSSVQQTYDLIFTDLDYAMANAPATAGYGRLTRHAAKAMKSKVLLYIKDWAGAASLALETINSGVYELKTDFRDLYAEGYKSTEVIFSPVSIFPNGINTAGSWAFPPSQSLKLAADKGIDDGDPLTDIDSDGDILTGTGFDPRFAYAHAESNRIPGVYNVKYPFPNVSGQQAGSHFVLRLGEIYLIYAEAKARLASGVDADALEKLNAIRNRAGLSDVAPATKAELIEAIRFEKQLELFGEFNEPWYDMIRYHILGDINISDLKPTITNNNQLILPFPVQALSGNGALVQNPGY